MGQEKSAKEPSLVPPTDEKDLLDSIVPSGAQGGVVARRKSSKVPTVIRSRARIRLTFQAIEVTDDDEHD